jgi:putative transposase
VDTVLLKRIYALIAVEHGSRRAPLIGVSAHPSGAWSTHAARTLLRTLADRATTITFLLRDRDSRFTTVVDAAFAADGIRILTDPPRTPRANAICERMIASPAPRARQDPDRQRTSTYAGFWPSPYSTSTPHGPHRTLGQLAPAQTETQPPPAINLAHHQIHRRPILGGLTSEYQMAAWPHQRHPNPQVKPTIQYSSPTG